MGENGYRVLAAKYIRRQARQLVAQFDGVRAAEDIEFVHRARVASRRLRAALRMFDDLFRPRRLKRWTKAVRRAAATLGDARDHDVQIEFLCGTLSALTAKECLLGVARVLVELERGRERLQTDVTKAVDRLESKGVLRQLRRDAKRLLPRVESAADAAPTSAAKTRTREHILRRIDELLERAVSLADADDQQGHHAMRIAVKRLRYTLEIARPLYLGRLDAPLESIKSVQSLLGDVHDCDVWEAQLNAFAAQQSRRITKRFGNPSRFARLQPGIEYLRRDRRQQRQRAFDQLLQLWGQLIRNDFWEGLRAIAGDEASATTESASAGHQAAAEECNQDSSAKAALDPARAMQWPNGNGSHEDNQAASKPPLTAGSG